MSLQTLHITAGEQIYPVYVGNSLLSDRALLTRHLSGKQVLIVTQQNIAELYLNKILQALSGYECEMLYLPQGEQHKNLVSWRKIMDKLIAKHYERSSTLIALGGGLIGDLTGFAAACYLRGVNYIQVPTTLIAQVDSAIGGKTGVNHRAGKNLIGSFYHPQCVIADTQTLTSLAPREFIAGLAEIIKYGLVRDLSFFSWLESHIRDLKSGIQEVLAQAIYTSIRIKGEIVAQDEREQSGLRSLLNFGHTMGHALEAFYQYRYFLHGEAVAIGMNLAAQLSLERGWLEEQDCRRIQALLQESGLPIQISPEIDQDKLFSYLMRDKKVSAQGLRWVLLKSIGQGVLTDQVSKEELVKLISR